MMERSIPPTAPAMPPKPTTEPTARRGKVSETSVKMLADKPWCAAAASAISATATHTLEVRVANTMGSTASAQISIAVLRARLTVQPRLMNADDSHPPPMLPTSATR